jgi:hypothetical protein
VHGLDSGDQFLCTSESTLSGAQWRDRQKVRTLASFPADDADSMGKLRTSARNAARLPTDLVGGFDPDNAGIAVNQSAEPLFEWTRPRLHFVTVFRPDSYKQGMFRVSDINYHRVGFDEDW